MPDVSKFNIENTEINVKDAIARTNATTALNKVIEIEQLDRIDITYASASETITISRLSHEEVTND